MDLDPTMHLRSLKTAIRTMNFDASKAFYTEVLGLPIVEEYHGEIGVRGCIVGFGETPRNAFLEISEISPEHTYYNAAFSRLIANDKVDLQIRTDAVDAWAKRLEANKWKARGPIDRPWGARYLYTRDPDGLQIIIYEEKRS